MLDCVLGAIATDNRKSMSVFVHDKLSGGIYVLNDDFDNLKSVYRCSSTEILYRALLMRARTHAHTQREREKSISANLVYPTNASSVHDGFSSIISE